MDLVPNHTSSAHPWFQAALAAGPGTDARERYIFRDGTGPGGVHPPNNWESIFGGPAWTRVTEPDGNPGQWYLHLFDAEQPDLNWENREVYDDLEKTLRFWLERGVDGFRIDVAHGMAKPPGLPDMEITKDEHAARRPGRRPAVQPRRCARHPSPHSHRARRLPARGRYRRGVGVRQRTVLPVPARRRAAPGLQFPAAAGRVRRGRHPRCDRELVGGSGDRERDADVDAVQPRRRPRTSPGTATAMSAWPARGRWRW